MHQGVDMIILPARGRVFYKGEMQGLQHSKHCNCHRQEGRTGGDTEKGRGMRGKVGRGKGKDCGYTQRWARWAEREGHLRVIREAQTPEERESWLKLDF